MIYMFKRARVLAVIIQLLLLSLPIYADFDPSNPPEPNVTHRLTVLMNPSNIGYCGNDGSYRAGEGVYVYSYPYDWNYKLKYWTINGYRYHETSNEFGYTMGDSAVTFIAYYEYEQPTPPPFDPGNPPEPYVKQNITVNIDPADAGYTDGTGSYSHNDGVYICAYIDYEYEFEYWTVNGYLWPEKSTCFYYQVGDTNAHFVAHVSKKHLITLKTQPRAAGTSSMQLNGMPIGDQLIAKGKKLDFSTFGNEEYKFSHWAINGHKHTTATSFSYTVGDSAAAVVAMYDYIGTGDTTLFNPDSPPEPDLRFDVTIVVVSENESKGTTEGGGTYVYGTTDTLYAYPAPGFEFRCWNDSVTDNPRIIYATQDSLFVAYFGNDTIARADTLCYGEHLQLGDVILDASGHYEFYTSRPDGIYIWNIVDLTILDRIYTDLDTTICFGESYEHDGVVYDVSGTYVHTYQNKIGCDSTVTINLNILPKVENTIIDTTICYGDSYWWSADSMMHTSSINKTVTLADVNGCDSVVTLNLTVLPAVPVTEIDTVTCNGVPFYWPVTGQSYSGSQVVTTTLTDIHGCDSVVRLNLVELSADAPVVVYDTTCYGVPYTWNITGKQYTGNCVVDTIVKSDIGCDIWMTLKLTELPTIPTTEIDTTICFGEAYYCQANHKIYTTSIDTTFTLKTVEHGCDSLVHLNLTILPKVPLTMVYDTLCYGESFLWDANGETYTQTTINKSVTLADVNGCDSVVTLNLTVLPEVRLTMVYDTLCYGEQYVFNNTTYTESTTVTATFVDVNGCDSVVTLNLTVLPAVPVTEIDTVTCNGVPFYWPVTGQSYSGSQVVTTTLTDIHGCDSVVFLNLIAMPLLTDTLSATICYGDSYAWMGNTYNTTGIYDQTLTSVVTGCDSTVVLNLTVLPEVANTLIIDTICYGESYVWSTNSKAYSTSTNDTVVLQNVNGCDSVVILNLTVLDPLSVNVVDTTICYGESIQWFGDTLYASVQGRYDTLLTKYGCEQVMMLNLTVLPEVLPTSETIVACDTYTWHGKDYTVSGTYVDTVLTAHGCDSVVTLYLTIHNSILTHQYETVCDSYTWYTGDVLTKSNTYYDTLTTVYGCDSVVALHLTVHQSTIGMPEQKYICYGDTTVWEGATYYATGLYSTTLTNAAGCDSTAYLQLTVLPKMTYENTNVTVCYTELPYMWYGQSLTTTGVYTHRETFAQNPLCDSIEHVLNLEVLPIDSVYITITACDSYTWNGQSYTDSGDYVYITTGDYGCDSVTILRLTIHRSTVGEPDTVVICYDDTYIWEGVEYDKSGFYTMTLNNAVGCDSMAYLHLTLLPEVLPIEESVTICYGESYTWYDHTYHESGDYTITYINDDGCPGLAILHLNVLPQVPVIEEWMEICYGESYTWQGNTYTKSGDYSVQYTNEYGCLCEKLLHLTVWPKNDPIEEWATITNNDTYTWYGKTYDAEGDYSIILQDQHGCDQEMILHLEVQVLDFRINAVEACADDPYVDFEIYSDMTIERVEFRFDESGLWKDTVVYMPKQYISIPNYARAGVYSVVISAYADGKYLGTKNQEFTLRFPSNVLLQHWDDFIGVLTYNYNGGYDFVSFQWYKDDQILPGETKSYLSIPLEMGALYSAMLEDVNGNKIMSCPIIATHQEELYLYPSLLQPNEIIHVRTTQQATIEMYDITGVQLMATDWEGGDLQLQAPATGGMYIIKVVYHDDANKVITRKITIR